RFRCRPLLRPGSGSGSGPVPAPVPLPISFRFRPPVPVPTKLANAHPRPQPSGHPFREAALAENGRRVAIVEGCRTPFATAGSWFRDMSPTQLGTVAVRELLSRADLPADEVDELVYGVVVPSIDAPNVGREVALAAGIPPTKPAFSVSRACASANQAITSAADQIYRGHASVMIAGGVEVLSDVPMLLSKK